LNDKSYFDATTGTNCFPLLAKNEKIDGIDQYIWVKKDFGGATAGTLGLTKVTNDKVECDPKTGNTKRKGLE